MEITWSTFDIYNLYNGVILTNFGVVASFLICKMIICSVTKVNNIFILDGFQFLPYRNHATDNCYFDSAHSSESKRPNLISNYCILGLLCCEYNSYYQIFSSDNHPNYLIFGNMLFQPGEETKKTLMIVQFSLISPILYFYVYLNILDLQRLNNFTIKGIIIHIIL